MRYFGMASWRVGLVVVLCLSLGRLWVHAGGSGLNTVIVVNSNSSQSKELGNYYSKKRCVPPGNIVGISWLGGNTSWSGSQFTNVLLRPLLEAITNRGLAQQIQCVVLSMDIPFRITVGGQNTNSTTAALYYGFQGPTSTTTANIYAGREESFAQLRQADPGRLEFLATMITANSLAAAKALVDRGAASDSTFPYWPVVLASTGDPVRDARSPQYEATAINTTINGNPSVTVSNQGNPASITNLFGFATGLAQFAVSTNAFVPGAIADSFTSFGGIIFGNNDQTNLLEFIQGGATASYGTVAEPLADTNKFPATSVYFYQGRGFNVAESYYQSLQIPYLGLVVAEPLAAPFAKQGDGSWSMAASNAVLSGVVPLELEFHVGPGGGLIDQVDLFVDGLFHSTLTNVAVTPGNQLALKLNGYPYAFGVTGSMGRSELATAFASVINASFVSNSTMISAMAHGDRIALRSASTNHTTFPFYLTFQSTLGTNFRSRNLEETTPPLIRSVNYRPDRTMELGLALPTALEYQIEASTNLADWSAIWVGSAPGFPDFIDQDAPLFPQRFYRVVGPEPYQPPSLDLLGMTNGNQLHLQMTSQPGQSCALLVSSNLQNWVPILTNINGGSYDYIDGGVGAWNRRFYRARLADASAGVVAFANPGVSTNLLEVSGATRPYLVEQSLDGLNWQTIVTNYGFAEIQTVADSTPSSDEPLTVRLRAARSLFLQPETFGKRTVSFFSGTLSANAWVKFTFTKTNGQMVVVGSTNQVAGLNATNIAFAAFNAINTNAALSGPDGVMAESFGVIGGQAQFVLRPRSSGYAAAKLRVVGKGSGFASGVVVAPDTVQELDENLADLQPQNHLYIETGVAQLVVDFLLDTRLLADGFHELTAVAYEGSSVRTQTRTTIPVVVSNSPLAAVLVANGLTNMASVLGNYEVQVLANTNTVTRTTLYSTGGALGVVSNSPSPNFWVVGTNLWIGTHPFYAVVETSTGQKYRTPTIWVELN